MNGGESTGDWSLLLLRGTAAVGSLWAGQDTAGSDDEDVTVGELLLKLAGEAVRIINIRILLRKLGKFGTERRKLTAAEICAIQEAMERGRR